MTDISTVGRGMEFEISMPAESVQRRRWHVCRACMVRLVSEI